MNPFEDDMPRRPPKLTKECDKWLAPTNGHLGRDRDVVLVLEAEFAENLTNSRFQPWELVAEIESLLGDHRVEVMSMADPKKLFRLDLPWKSYKHPGSFQELLSSLARPEGWKALDLLWTNWFDISASRGRGDNRRGIWGLDYKKAAPKSLPSIRIAIRTDHLPLPCEKRVQAFVQCFFRKCADADAVYGRGELVVVSNDPLWTSDIRLDNECVEGIWNEVNHLALPIVPWAHRFNLLNVSRLKAIGGLDAIQRFVIRDRALLVESMGEHALVTCRNIDDATLEVELFPSPAIPPYEFEANCLLALYSRAKMLAVQNMDWVDAYFDRYAATLSPSAATNALRPQRRKRRDSWIPKLKTRPPRFVKGCAKPSLVPLKGRLSAEIHANTTHFDIESTHAGAGLTLYGGHASDPATVVNPILAGSMKHDRAAFVFDTLREGWDGARNTYLPPEAKTQRRLRQFKCPGCDRRHFRLRAIFEYTDDLDELSKEEQAHAQDFFTWFWLVATCTGCSWQGIAADIECA